MLFKAPPHSHINLQHPTLSKSFTVVIQALSSHVIKPLITAFFFIRRLFIRRDD